MAASEWIQFFTEAGIPPGPAVSYAVTFADNRIRKTMLPDLTKELMNELGVTAVGDVIAILKHAKLVHRQEMCKAATESLRPASPGVRGEPRRDSAAGRMIANSLSRCGDAAAAAAPPRASQISVTVPNRATEEGAAFPAKRRRVTAEMEGKYVVRMPRGTTPRTRKILQLQAARGLQRTSVFERLGAEAKGDGGAGGKPSGVFSRLGDAAEAEDAAAPALPYAGVLKNLSRPVRRENAAPGSAVKAGSAGSEAKPAGGTAATPEAEAQDSSVSSTKGKSRAEFRVTIQRTWGCGKVSSSSDGPAAARMDGPGARSVFQRLGRKTP